MLPPLLLPLPLDEPEPGALELEPLGLEPLAPAPLEPEAPELEPPLAPAPLEPELGLALLPAPPMLEPALPLDEESEPEVPLVDGELDDAAPGAAGEVEDVPDGEAPEDEDEEDESPPAAGAEGVLGVVGVGDAGLVAAEPLEVEPGAAPEVPEAPPPESLLQPASSAARMLAANRAFEGLVSFIVDFL